MKRSQSRPGSSRILQFDGAFLVPASRRRLLYGLVASIAGPFLAAWTAVNIAPDLPGLLFLSAILLAVGLGRLLAGAVAVVLSSVLLHIYALSSADPVRAGDSREWLSLTVFVLFALVASQLVLWRERQLAQARVVAVRLQLAVDSAQMGTWEWNMKSGDVVWDARLEQIYGLDVGTFDGSYETYLSLVHPDDVEALTAAVSLGIGSRSGHHHTHRIVRPDGETRWVDGASKVVFDGGGEVAGMVGVSLDVTDRRRAEEIARNVQSVADAALSSLRFDELANTLLGRVMAAVDADAACVLLASPDGLFLEEIASVGAREHRTGERFLAGRGVSGRVLTSDAPVVIDDLSLASPVRGWLRQMCSFAGVQIQRGGQTIGVLHVTTRRLHRFDEQDTQLLSLAGGRIASALERARLYEDERRASFRLRILAEAGEVLASSTDYESTLARVAGIAVPAFADWCSVELLGPRGELSPLGITHVDPTKEAAAWKLREEFPFDPDAAGGPAAVIRTGAPELRKVISKEEIEAGKAANPELADVIDTLAFESMMLVPLSVPSETPLGVMTFVMSGSGRHFDESDLSLGMELGRRSALAIANARLFSERDRIAETFELSLRAPRMPEIPGVQVAGSFSAAGVAAGSVAGDFFDVFSTDGEDWLAVIGDVCGKGPEAAAIMALSRYTVRTAALLSSGPTFILDTLNEALLSYGADRFSTVIVTRFRVEGDAVVVELASGGHPPPLIARRDGIVDEVPARGPLVGIFEEAEFSSLQLRLEAGDLLVMYTDGVTEARGEQGFFGEGRLHDRLRARAGSSARTVADELLADVQAFGDGTDYDDIAILALGPG